MVAAARQRRWDQMCPPFSAFLPVTKCALHRQEVYKCMYIRGAGPAFDREIHIRKRCA